MLINRNSPTNQAGFTIVELMIATLIFSIIMIVTAVGITEFTHQYYNGIVSSNTQEAARSIMAEVTQALEFSKVETAFGEPGQESVYCIDNSSFSYEINQEVTDGASDPSNNQEPHALVENNNVGSQCNLNNLPNLKVANLGLSQRELLPAHMRLSVFNITGPINGLYTVEVRVVYGDNSLLTHLTPQLSYSEIGCQSGAGSQFCAVSDLQTTVQNRLYVSE
jgi:prepilin-type N-terminal cleavage/methylation domain-containing protein